MLRFFVRTDRLKEWGQSRLLRPLQLRERRWYEWARGSGIDTLGQKPKPSQAINTICCIRQKTGTLAWRKSCVAHSFIGYRLKLTMNFTTIHSETCQNPHLRLWERSIQLGRQKSQSLAKWAQTKLRGGFQKLAIMHHLARPCKYRRTFLSGIWTIGQNNSALFAPVDKNVTTSYNEITDSFAHSPGRHTGDCAPKIHASKPLEYKILGGFCGCKTIKTFASPRIYSCLIVWCTTKNSTPGNE